MAARRFVVPSKVKKSFPSHMGSWGSADLRFL